MSEEAVEVGARRRRDAAGVSFVRVFFIGGAIAYRGLFNWVHPRIYIPTMLIGPLFQILFFAYLGRYSGLENDAFFVVGNAVQSSAMSSVFAGTMAIANERQYQTLSPLLATPANRFAIFMGRSLPVIASGLLVSGWGFVMGRLLLHFHPPLSSVPPLALVTVVSVVSGTAFGLTLGSVGMRARDVFMIANVAYYLMWLLCGVNIPLDALPGWLEQIGRLMPLTHGIAAAREIASGASLSSVGGLVWTELGVAAAWGTIAFTLVRYFEYEGRRRASLETY
jgi:ABC-2 type transport system permease protein